MSNGLARASVRFRPATFVGTLIALLFGAAVVTACGTLLQTGVTASLHPVRYANSPVVVVADQNVAIEVTNGHSKHTREKPTPERARIDAALTERIAALPGVAAARPDSAFPVTAPSVPNTLTGRPYAALGIAGPQDVLLEGRAPGANEVVLDADTARAAHLAPGASLTLTAPGGTASYRVSGLAAPQTVGPTIWLADTDADRLSGHPGRIDAIAVQPRPGTTDTALAAEIRRTLGGPGPLDVRTRTYTGDARGAVEHPTLGEARVLLIAIGGSFGGNATATAIFVVVSTVALATSQRAREFALLRAIGATPRQIRRTIATEAALLAPAAATLGALPGIALARWWLDQLVERGAVPAGVHLDVGPLPVLVAVAACTLAALAAGYLAALRPSRLRPGQALGEAAIPPARTGWVRTGLGLLFAVGGVVLAFVAAALDGEQAANTALGVVMCFLTAVSFLGPWVARVFATVLGAPLRAAGAPGSLAADNARANARRLASAITPIVLVTAFCGTMLALQGTLRHTADTNVRTGVTADHVVTAAGPGLPAGTAERAARLPGVDTAVGVLNTGLLYDSGEHLSRADALAVDGDPARLSRVLDLGVRTGSLADLGRSTDTVALDAMLADSLGARVGERVPLRLGDGTAVRPTLVATYERGLGLGRALLPRAAVAAHVTAAYDGRLLVADAPGADRTAVAAALKGIDRRAQVTDRAGYAAQADRNLEINGWANTVMAAVLGGFAAVSAANTLVMTVLDRRRELALLRLAGTTRRQVRGMLRWEALIVAASGLALGAAIAWVTLLPVARGIAGTGPYVPPLLAGALPAGAVLLCLAATALPVRALLRGNPVTAVGGA
ncbi:ABC transporter permease [Streptomyces sp. NRRL WC-3742]|uniref:ABC transporter permease n=1 Tax=Streptomyces sp. NRRL WC-3742 TaxID=1463934 RepID=UPI0004C945A2|nr:ABC transporter permease [Streptomyces sp. NRRL WC-3742]